MRELGGKMSHSIYQSLSLNELGQSFIRPQLGFGAKGGCQGPF